MQLVLCGKPRCCEDHIWGTALLGRLSSPGVLTAFSLPKTGVLKYGQKPTGPLGSFGYRYHS